MLIRWTLPPSWGCSVITVSQGDAAAPAAGQNKDKSVKYVSFLKKAIILMIFRPTRH